MSKYKAIKTEVDGITFPSKKQAERYLILKSYEAEGRIHGLKTDETHKEDLTFVLQEGFTDNQGKKHRPIKYIGDFSYLGENGWRVIEDAKGMKTPVFRIKEKLFRKKYPGRILKLT